MVEPATPATDTVNPAEEIERQSIHAKANLEIPHETKRESFQEEGPALTTTAVKKQKSSEANRMRRALSAHEGIAINPRKPLPKNNMMAMYKLMFEASRSLKEFVKTERKEMKKSNENWKKHSNERAECSERASANVEWWGNMSFGLSVATGVAHYALKSDIIAQVAQGANSTISQYVDASNNKTTSESTRADYSKDSSRSDFDMCRDEMRQLEQAVDQTNSQLIELMRLEAKAYSREGG